MGRRLVSVLGRVKGGPARGGTTRELRIYDDEAMTALSTLYARSTGAVNIAQPVIPNAGKQVFLTADRAAADAFVIVTDVASFSLGQIIPIYDAVNTVYRVITAITPATKRLDLDQALGFIFTAATAKVNNADMEGWIWFYVDDAADKYGQVKELATGRFLPPLNFPVRVPVASVSVQDEGAAVAAQSTLNFIGGTITATNDGANNRINVTVLAGPDNASYVTTAAEAGLSNEKVLGTVVITKGVIGSRPAASVAGYLYWSTDETPPTLYRDTVAAWDGIGFTNPATTRGDILVRTSTGLTRVALGASGTFLNSDGTDAVWGLAHKIEVFTGNGTWTKAARAKFVMVVLFAGGGGGGGGAQTDNSGWTPAGGGGGGGGAYLIRFYDPSALGATETVTIGSGGTAGTGGSASAGGIGGTSSFGSHVSAFGGGGGYGAINNNTNTGGGGGGGSMGAGTSASGTTAGLGGSPRANPVPGPSVIGPGGADGGVGASLGGAAENGGGGGPGGGINIAGLGGGTSINGGPAGGAGAGCTITSGGGTVPEKVGGPGGTINAYTTGGAANGGAIHTAGTAGTSRSGTGKCGDGGGGGGSNVSTATVCNGGAGGAPSGGGGGGGAGSSTNGCSGGQGGAGGRGEAYIVTFF